LTIFEFYFLTAKPLPDQQSAERFEKIFPYRFFIIPDRIQRWFFKHKVVLVGDGAEVTEDEYVVQRVDQLSVTGE